MNLILKSQDMLYKIKNKLLNNNSILKLLYYSSPDALESAEVDRAEGEKRIILNPVVEYNTEDSNLNNFIAISIPGLDFGATGEASVIALDISVVCNVSNWELDNNKVRIMELASLLQQELEGMKVLFSGRLMITSMIPVIYEDNLVGYTIKLFALEDNQAISIN